MNTRIALFNHKGGVSKTTTTFHLGWMLASKGYKVILVDADPQCNLTGLILGYKGEAEFENFYQKESDGNLRSGLAPAFESQPHVIEPVQCLPVEGRQDLFLLPGHIRLSEYEVTLGIAQELSGTIQTLQNLPGSISFLLDITAKKYAADFVLIDVNPSLSSINQNLLMTSDYFLVPASPDYFSVMAIDSLSAVIPRWANWSRQAQASPTLKSAAYPYPDKTPRLLGTIIQKYRPRKGAPTVGFQRWIDAINERVAKRFVPTLTPINMVLSQSDYSRISGFVPHLCIAQIADFNNLIAKSQVHATPVFALTNEQLEHVGTVLESDQEKQAEFQAVFSELADRIILLTGNAKTH
jgi:cellulose biosynthesis protein BcsQ